MKMDINCDLGEGFGHWKVGLDELVMPLITSANIACGFHAGDPIIMRKTVKLALDHKVGIGAHPGFPDLQGFGRRAMTMPAEDVRDYVLYQISALKGFVEAEGGHLQHVKAHGALYNIASKDPVLARALVAAIQELDDRLIVLCPAQSEMARAAMAADQPWRAEVFADRAYMADGSLAPRSLEGAVHKDQAKAVLQALELAKGMAIPTLDGKQITLKASSICVHGDTEGALDLVRSIRATFQQDGIDIEPMGTR